MTATTIAGVQDATALVQRAWSIGLKPPPRLTLTKWANKHFWTKAASVEPGKWNTSRTPYLQEPMDCLSSSSPVREIAVMKGTQLGFTTMLVAWICFVAAEVRADMLIVLPDMASAKKWAKVTLKTTIAANPVLNGVFRPARERDSGNSQLFMQYAGGYSLSVTWSSSAPGLKSFPVPYVVGDEIDSWVKDVDGEGDPVTMAARRQKNFHNRKFPKISTPTKDGSSRIQKLFNQGDQRRYFAPCPHCNHFQVLQRGNFRYEPADAAKQDDIQSAWFECISCRERITEDAKAAWYDPQNVLTVWIPTRDQADLVSKGFPGDKLPALLEKKAAVFTEFASFHLPTPYAPLGWTGSSWFAIAQEAVLAKTDAMVEVSHSTQTWGEPVKVKGEMPDYRKIEDRAEDSIELEVPQTGMLIAKQIPAGGLILTCAVDAQRTWIEGEIRAWGPRRESWSVGHFQIYGETEQEAIWEQLADLILARDYQHALGGTLPIHLMSVDCNYNSESVYRFCRRHPQPIYGANHVSIPTPRTVIPIRGGHKIDILIEKFSTQDQARKRAGLRIVTYSAHVGKQLVYDRLRLQRGGTHEQPPLGYIHFPRYDRHFFLSATAEKLVMKADGEIVWVEEYQRNEVLDCLGYQEGNCNLLGLESWSEARWAERRRAVTRTPETINRDPKAEQQRQNTAVFANYSDDPFLS